MEKIKIGKIVNAVGLKGEVKVYNYSDSEEVYERTPEIYAGDRLLKVQNVRMQKNMVILKLSGIDDRNAAEAAKGTELFITEADLPELPEGQFYIRDHGVVTDVLQNTAQDIFEVKRDDGKTVLIPKVDAFVQKIDGKERLITVTLIEGLTDL